MPDTIRSPFSDDELFLLCLEQEECAEDEEFVGGLTLTVPGGFLNDIQFQFPVGTFAGTPEFTWVTGNSQQTAPFGLQIGSATGLIPTITPGPNSEHMAIGNWAVIDNAVFAPGDPVNQGIVGVSTGIISICDHLSGAFTVNERAGLTCENAISYTGVPQLQGFLGLDVNPSVNSDSTGPMAQAVGVWAGMYNYGRGNIANLNGSYSLALSGNTTCNVDGVGAAHVTADNHGTVNLFLRGVDSLSVNRGTVTGDSISVFAAASMSAGSISGKMIGLQSKTFISGGGSVPTVAQAWLQRAAGAAATTNTYGLFIEDQSGISAISENIHSAGAASINKFEGEIDVGLQGGHTGNIHFIGTTSGVVNLTTADAAGTWTMKLPTSGGTNGFLLQTDGTGVTSWVAVAAGNITVGVTTITGGTDKHVVYDKLGIFQEAAQFTIDEANGNANIVTGGQLEYNGSQVLQAQPSLNNFFDGGSGNLTGTGADNTGTGFGALAALTTGARNSGIGSSALAVCTSGTDNAAIGKQALGALTTGQFNLALGQGSGLGIVAGIQNVAFGHNAMGTGDASNNVAIGNNALAADVTGTNVAIGSQTMVVSTTASNCLGIGPSALHAITSGSNNVGIGGSAGGSLTSGPNNTCVGTSALISCTVNQGNTAIGRQALNNTDAEGNVGIGWQAGNGFTSGHYNCIVGTGQGQGITTGNFNTILGCNFNFSAYAAGTAGCIIITTGDGTVQFDYNFTTASKFTFAHPIIVTPQTTAGFIMNDASGNYNSVNTVAAATVAANFSADHRIQITVAGVTYFLPVSTVAW